jgi:hypothetical protein
MNNQVNALVIVDAKRIAHVPEIEEYARAVLKTSHTIWPCPYAEESLSQTKGELTPQQQYLIRDLLQTDVQGHFLTHPNAVCLVVGCTKHDPQDAEFDDELDLIRKECDEVRSWSIFRHVLAACHTPSCGMFHVAYHPRPQFTRPEP